MNFFVPSFRLAFKVNTDKATKKMSALLKGLPPSKRYKGPEGAKKDVPVPSTGSLPTEPPAAASAFRLEDEHNWKGPGNEGSPRG